jgi:AP-5 complex subunit zeta-1
MLLALMDEAYTGSAIEDPSGNSGSDDTGPLDLADPMFLDLLKDENDGIAVSNSSYPILYILIDFPLNF